VEVTQRVVRSAVVVGAGPAGLVAAIALRHAGIDAIVCERAVAGSDAGSGLTLWPNAMKALDHVGAAEAVRRVGAPCDGISMRNARGRVLDRTPRRLLEERFGGTGFALHRAELLEALAGVLGPGVLRFETACVGVEQDSEVAAVRLEDGTRLRADVVIGADGIGSLVRRAIFGSCKLRYAGYPVWRAVTPFELAGAERTGTLTLGRGAQFGLFPMTSGRVYWFAALDAEEGTAPTGAAAKRLLLERFGAWHDPIDRVLEATGDAAIVASDVHELEPLRRWSLGRVTLVGDAAHAGAPALGQGACQAIEDAVVLAHCLRGHRRVDAAFADFERRRLGRANRTVREARAMSRVGQWRSPLACRARDALIRLTPGRLQLRHLEWLFSFEP
jgi:2-polyprenyl-6-methoxyphenol hydroxylase-like FAD-dependent oxidoreductase